MKLPRLQLSLLQEPSSICIGKRSLRVLHVWHILNELLRHAVVHADLTDPYES